MSGTSSGLGEVEIKSLKWGNIDLNNKDCLFSAILISENILEPRGPFCSVVAKDFSDAIGKNKANGGFNEDIEIKLKATLGSTGLMGGNGSELSFKFKPLMNKNNNDNSQSGRASGRYKEFTLMGCSEEYLKSQKVYQKSYFDTTSNMVKDLLEKGYGTKKKVNVSETEGKVRYTVDNKNPTEALSALTEEHVSSNYKSSCYVCFQKSGDNGKEAEYHFKTFEELFEQSPVAKYKAKTTNITSSASLGDKQFHILNMNVPDSFFAATRPFSKASAAYVNLSTHSVHRKNAEEKKFKLPDQPTYNGQTSYTEDKTVPVYGLNDSVNNKEKRRVSDVKRDRAEFLSHLVQNSAEIEIIGNPSVKLGSMIELEIPKRTQEDPSSGEPQFNGKALVVAIKHIIRPPNGPTPRYTMKLRLVKASYKQGGDDA
jgi:hypothetical protein